MKTEQPILITSIKCNFSLGMTKHHFVGFDGNPGQEAKKSLGVCYANTAYNEMMPVVVDGIVLVTAFEPINVGDGVEAFDDGTAKVYDSGFLEGYALDASSAYGELIRVKLV